MPPVTLSNGDTLHVPDALERAIAATAAADVSFVAQVAGADRTPAVVMIAGDELVLVDGQGAQRWPLSEIARVEGLEIVTRSGSPVPITGWWYAPQAERFRAALREAIGQSATPHARTVAARAGGPAEHELRSLALRVGVLTGILVSLGLATLAAFAINAGPRISLLVYLVIAIQVLALPLLASGIKLVRVDSEWRALGIAGISVGAIATAATALVLVGFMLVLAACSSNACSA